MAERNCCSGKCCEAFSLGENDIDSIRADADTEEGRFIADMLGPLGYFNRNPLFDLGTETYAVQEMRPGSRTGAWFYTCRHFDRATRSCTAYEQRPTMCRKFPNDGACNYPGCEFQVPRRMHESYRFPGLYTAKRVALSPTDMEQLAKALGCPEHPMYAEGAMILKATDGPQR